MLSDKQRTHLKLAARTMQIIAWAMAAGILFFLAIVLVLASQNGRGPVDRPFLTYFAAAFAFITVILWAIVPSIVAARMRQAIVDRDSSHMAMAKLPNAAELGDVAPLTAVYQTRLIIGAALSEGAAFVSLVAYMLERQPVSLIAAVVLLLVLLAQIPTVSRLEAWMEGELATIERLRLMRRA